MASLAFEIPTATASSSRTTHLTLSKTMASGSSAWHAEHTVPGQGWNVTNIKDTATSSITTATEQKPPKAVDVNVDAQIRRPARCRVRRGNGDGAPASPRRVEERAVREVRVLQRVGNGRVGRDGRRVDGFVR